MKINKFLYLTVNENPSKPDFFIKGDDIRDYWLMTVINTPKLAEIFDSMQGIEENFGRRNTEGVRYVSEIDFEKLRRVASRRASEKSDLCIYNELFTTMDAITKAKTKLESLKEFIARQFVLFTGQTPPPAPSKTKPRKARRSRTKKADVVENEYEDDAYDEEKIDEENELASECFY